VNTISEQAIAGRRRRRTHSDEFKADAVAACMQPGISMAAVAMSREINANLLRRWVREAEAHPPAFAATTSPASRPALLKPAFVPLPMPAAATPRDICIELRRGALSITVTWPSTSAAECANWMRELLR
jgi:transposase